MEKQSTQTPSCSITVAAKAYVFKGDKLLILRKPEKDRLGGSFPETTIDFPGGKLEPGESWQTGLLREVAEEVQLTIAVGAPFNAWSRMGKYRHILGVDFLAEWVSGEVVLSEEHDAYQWLTLDELRDMHDILLPDIERAFMLRDQLYTLHSI